MIRGCRILPTAKSSVQRRKELCGVQSIGFGVECLVEAGKRVRMMQQADLVTADIDAVLTRGLSCACRAYCLTAAIELPADAIDIDRPGPGCHTSEVGIPVTAFNSADCQQKARRKLEFLLRVTASLFTICRGLRTSKRCETADCQDANQ